LQFRQIAPAVQNSADVAVAFRAFQNFIQISAHLFIPLKISVNVSLRGFLSNAQLFGQTESAHAVENAKVDYLRLSAHFGIYHFRKYAENIGCRAGVNVFIGLESINECFVFGKMRQHAQFNLRIIGGNKFIARRGNESLSDSFPFRRADGDVLQVGI